MSILGMIEFYVLLAEELIDNRYNDIALGWRRTVTTGTSPTMYSSTGIARAGVGGHLTPTKRRRKNAPGQQHQGR